MRIEPVVITIFYNAWSPNLKESTHIRVQAIFAKLAVIVVHAAILYQTFVKNYANM